MTIDDLAYGELFRFVDRLVIDRTELKGTFDWTLVWTPDQPTQAPVDSAGATSASPDRTSIFTAIQEQLGLKLEATRGRVDVLVIDHIEHPTEN